MIWNKKCKFRKNILENNKLLQKNACVYNSSTNSSTVEESLSISSMTHISLKKSGKIILILPLPNPEIFLISKKCTFHECFTKWLCQNMKSIHVKLLDSKHKYIYYSIKHLIEFIISKFNIMLPEMESNN